MPESRSKPAGGPKGPKVLESNGAKDGLKNKAAVSSGSGTTALAANAPGKSGVAGAPTTPPARKPLGVKEVIPFAWKLVGVSDGLVLTLFKSVEKEEADAQHERLKAEGYYSNLAVVDINTKVRPPRAKRKAASPAKAKRSSRTRKSARAGAKASKAASTASTRVADKPKRKRSTKARSSVAKTKKRASTSSTKKKTAKSTAKARKKKTRKKK